MLYLRMCLLLIAQTLTGKPRYLTCQWDNKIWVANIFRLYEYLFGRAFGIRAEAATTVEYENGRLSIKREFYTLEALLAHCEATIRGYLFFYKTLFCAMPLNYQVTYVTFVVFGFTLSFHAPQHLLPLFGLAIAFDVGTDSTAGTTSPLTWSHTCTGANGMLSIASGDVYSIAQPTTTAVSYNSVGATKAVGKQGTAGGSNDDEISIWLLGNPATGSHTVSCTISFTSGSGPKFGGISVSYTGAKNTNAADATQSGNAATSGAQSISITTIAANCWIVCAALSVSTSSATISATQTQRGTTLNVTGSANSTMLAVEDTNGGVAGGAHSVGFTFGGLSFNGWLMVAASFAPVQSSAISFNHLRPAIFKPMRSR